MILMFLALVLYIYNWATNSIVKIDLREQTIKAAIMEQREFDHSDTSLSHLYGDQLSNKNKEKKLLMYGDMVRAELEKPKLGSSEDQPMIMMSFSRDEDFNNDAFKKDEDGSEEGQTRGRILSDNYDMHNDDWRNGK